MTAIEWLFNELWEVPKDKLTWHSILNKAKEMESSQTSKDAENISLDNSPKVQTKDSFGEISDEEIEDEVKKINLKFGASFSYGFILAIKWYREKLKQL